MSDSMMWVCPKCGNIKGGFEGDQCSRCGTEVIVTEVSLHKYLYEFDSLQSFRWREDTLKKYVKSSPEFDEEAMNKRLTAEFKERQAEQNKPKCPTCGSTNIKKISGLERGASVMTLGLLSRKINKTFKCGNCGYTW